MGGEGTVLLYYWIPSEKMTDRPYASMIMCAHISWWGKNKQTNISKNKDGITGHESKRLMSCQEKLHSSVKYIGKCLIAVKSTMKRSDECVFLQQRKIILSEKSSLLRKKNHIMCPLICILRKRQEAEVCKRDPGEVSQWFLY